MTEKQVLYREAVKYGWSYSYNSKTIKDIKKFLDNTKRCPARILMIELCYEEVYRHILKEYNDSMDYIVRNTPLWSNYTTVYNKIFALKANAGLLYKYYMKFSVKRVMEISYKRDKTRKDYNDVKSGVFAKITCYDVGNVVRQYLE